MSSFFLPLVGLVIVIYVLPEYLTKTELVNVTRQLDFYLIYGLWIMFAFARLFFIIALRKSVSSLTDQKDKNESTGFLDDFAQ
jgi:hypothetical protein